MRNTPNIRFKGFTDDWEQRKFSNYYKMSSGYAFKMSDYCNDGIGLINGESIQYGMINDNNLNHLPETFIQQYSDFILKQGDIVVGLNRPITNGNLKIARIPSKYNNSLLYQRAGKIVYKKECDKDFSYVLLSQEILKHTLVEAVGSDQPFISTSKLDKWEMMMPIDIKEQHKIGEYFKNLDHLITLHQRKSFLYFSRINDWEQRKLNEVAEFNPKSELPDEFEYVDLESVVGTEMISHRTETKDSAPSRAQRLAQPGDVFFQTVRPYQKNNYLFSKLDNNYVFSTGYAQMRPNIDTAFLMSFLQTDSFVKIVLDNCTGTSYPAINSSDLSNLEISLPKSFEEQKKVGKTIISIDNLITLHRRAYYNKKGGLTNVHNDNQQYYAIL